ncbi:MAG: tetratricopeptide repeat protein [Gammaproteobacteria bacterium]|nr:tetratricopeptide repeat protein [Gammaproteobacteria bacterium]
MTKIYLLILFIVSLINGCSTIDYSRKGETESIYKTKPVEERSTTPDVVVEDVYQPRVITTAAVDHDVSAIRKKSVPPASRLAVLDLLAQSKSAIDEGDYGTAERLLNRALRIEPGNAWLWHNMAVLNFYQEDYQQAIQQALKSDNLEKNNAQLGKNNAKVIKQSYLELGEPQKAQQYEP